MASKTDYLGNTSQYTYDAQGNQVRVTDPIGRVMDFSYDSLGRISTVINPNGKTYTYTVDARSAVTAITDPLGLTVNLTLRPADSSVTRLRDAKGNDTEFGYDSSGRLISISNALGQTATKEYDAIGRISKISAPSGISTMFSYDALDRVVAAQMPDDVVQIQYNDALRSENYSNKDSILEIKRDPVGRAVNVRQIDKLDGSVFETSYVYDANGNRTDMTTPFGIYHYTYDNIDTILSLQDPSGETFSWQHNPNAVITAAQYPNGVRTDLSYDAATRLTGLTTARGFTGGFVSTYTYVMDGVNNITSLRDSSGLHTYSYDDIMRLTSVQHPQGVKLPHQSEAYTYDAGDNRISSHRAASYSYDAANRLLSDGTYEYVYNADGQLTLRTETSTGKQTAFSYNGVGLLARVEDMAAGRVSTYRYDPTLRRTMKRVQLGNVSQTWRYFYDGSDVIQILVEDVDASGNKSVNTYRLTYGPGIDNPLVIRGSADRYLHYNHQSSIDAVTDDSGAVIERVEYDSFGVPVFIDGVSGSTSSASAVAGNPYAYNGREWDPDTGLYYYRARYYDPTIGRFIQEDSQIATNQYIYTRNNPVNLMDPTGEAAVVIRTNTGRTLMMYDPGIAGINKMLKQVGNDTIENFVLIGHANGEFIETSPGGHATGLRLIYAPNYEANIMKADRLADMLRGRMSKTGSVMLAGCNTAVGGGVGDSKNLAGRLSNKLKGTNVYGMDGYSHPGGPSGQDVDHGIPSYIDGFKVGCRDGVCGTLDGLPSDAGIYNQGLNNNEYNVNNPNYKDKDVWSMYQNGQIRGAARTRIW